MKQQTLQPPTKEQFVIAAIKGLQDPKYPNSIHTVFSGLNTEFEKAFGVPSRETIDKMKAAGKIDWMLVKGGPIIALPGTFAARQAAKETKPAKALAVSNAKMSKILAQLK